MFFILVQQHLLIHEVRNSVCLLFLHDHLITRDTVLFLLIIIKNATACFSHKINFIFRLFWAVHLLIKWRVVKGKRCQHCVNARKLYFTLIQGFTHKTLKMYFYLFGKRRQKHQQRDEMCCPILQECFFRDRDGPWTNEKEMAFYFQSVWKIRGLWKTGPTFTYKIAVIDYMSNKLHLQLSLEAAMTGVEVKVTISHSKSK